MQDPKLSAADTSLARVTPSSPAIISTSISTVTMFRPNLSSVIPVSPPAPLISGRAVEILFIVVVRVAQLIIATFGVFSNVTNVIVYAKMGYTETSSITLTALSLADLVTELWLLLMAAGYRPAAAGIDVPPLTVTLVHVLSPVSNAVLGYGSWVTALISMERCLCIVFPMKVGRL